MNDTPLGKHTEYPKAYSRDLLAPISREHNRAQLPEYSARLAFTGYDLWTLYELSWLNAYGTPQVMMAELRVPADSPNIVESISLKLYINSLYYQRFTSSDELAAELVEAISASIGAAVGIHLWPLVDFPQPTMNHSLEMIDLDQFSATPASSPNIKYVEYDNVEGYKRIFKTDLFRSLCPVTGQPDWATVYIALNGIQPNIQMLSAYMLGYREHQGFHEACVEQIYADLTSTMEPQGIAVAARYTRRGGIDINPYRYGGETVFEMPGRTVRQ